MDIEEITYQIRGAIFDVYNELGPGLLESIYESALICELRSRGLAVHSQEIVPVYYKGEKLPIDYRLDLIVENAVIVEIKSVEELSKLHYKQLMTYMRLRGCEVGILVNFNTDELRRSIKRIVL